MDDGAESLSSGGQRRCPFGSGDDLDSITRAHAHHVTHVHARPYSDPCPYAHPCPQAHPPTCPSAGTRANPHPSPGRHPLHCRARPKARQPYRGLDLEYQESLPFRPE